MASGRDDDIELQKFLAQHAPIEVFNKFNTDIENFCKANELDKAYSFFTLFREQHDHYRLNDQLSILIGSSATTLAMAYARAGNREKVQEVLDLVQSVYDSSHRPIIDVPGLRRILSTLHNI